MAGRGQWVGRLREVRALEHVPGETEKLGTPMLSWENEISSVLVDPFHPSLERHTAEVWTCQLGESRVRRVSVTVRQMTKYNVEMSRSEKILIWLFP